MWRAVPLSCAMRSSSPSFRTATIMSSASADAFDVQRNVCIAARDGVLLSANLWLPRAQSAGQKFPVVLEMIPYRKDDWRYEADHARMGYLAQHGFAGCRVDVRGTGSSAGVALDEYTAAETQDGCDVVAWLAAQPWCNGSVGMWGISYGGFTSIQVAMQQPPALKAILPMYASADRYTDDVHYLGGCKTVSEMLGYTLSQIGMNALPPVPAISQAGWLPQWRERLEQTPPWVLNNLRQQQDGGYWRRGSLAPDYGRIKCAMLLVGGWNDGYTNSALRMLQHCTAPRRAIIGPWGHTLPHAPFPGPAVDWMQEMVRFFGHWLRGDQNGVMHEPALLYYETAHSAPQAFPVQLPGSWQATSAFGGAQTANATLWLGTAALCETSPAQAGVAYYAHRPAHGTHAALCWGPGGLPTGLARDMRADDALVPGFSSAPLVEPLRVLGNPRAVLFVSSSAPVAAVVVRLSEVAPDGTPTLVSTGILNLAHRNGHGQPQALDPGTVYEVHVELKGIGHQFSAGNALRLSVSSGWWPVLWPTPHAAHNQLHWGAACPARLELPLAPGSEPLPVLKFTPPNLVHGGSHIELPPRYEVVEDVLADTVTVRVFSGDRSELAGGISLGVSEAMEMTAHNIDPAHVTVATDIHYDLEQAGQVAAVHVHGTIKSTATHFNVDLRLRAAWQGEAFYERAWVEAIARDWL